MTTNALGQPIGDSLPNWQSAIHPSKTTLEGSRCRLEPVSIDKHAAELFAANAANNDGSMWTYLPYGPFDNLTQYSDWMRATCLGNDPLFFAIIDIATDKAIGLASYLRIEPKIGSIEVGHLAYSPALQRTPIATEAMYLLMQHAFKLGYRRYEWKCDALNAPSRRAAERLGFSYEGLFRQATIVKGRNRDTAWFAIIDRDWPALRAAFEYWLAPKNFDSNGRQHESLSALTAPLIAQRD